MHNFAVENIVLQNLSVLLLQILKSCFYGEKINYDSCESVPNGGMDICTDNG
jgi:hypothetical protein